MTAQLVRKYIKVWVKRRKNNPRKGGKAPTVSYTLQWAEHGLPKFMSLGPHATLAYAKEAARLKEAELNSFEKVSSLDAISWEDFRKKYMDTKYPGHDLPPGRRQEAMKAWTKSWASCRSERLALDNFERLAEPGMVHEVTTRDRDNFTAKRLAEVSSAASVDTDLRVLRAVFNVAEEWRHIGPERNPFAGRGKATVGARQKRQKERQSDAAKRGKHYTFEEVKNILALATKESSEADEATRWGKKRLRTLVYFVAYTGCRINEALHLEWKDVDWDGGVAMLYFKVENDLKTEGSQAPFGLPGKLVAALKEWEADREEGVSWVFPNERGKPWKGGGPGYRAFDQLKELGERAGVQGANWKRFRHTIATLGKARFGMSREQVKAQLRHTLESTQEHYTHDDKASLRAAAQRIDFEA